MAFHLSGAVVEIVGIVESSRGRLCEEHTVCGAALQLDAVVCLCVVQVITRNREETVIVVHWVRDGIDCCRVGFLPQKYVKDSRIYSGRLAQIVELLGVPPSLGYCNLDCSCNKVY
jgi:hypothetical protein